MEWNKIVISTNTFNKIKVLFNEVNITKYKNCYYTNNGLEIIVNDIVPDNELIKIKKEHEI